MLAIDGLRHQLALRLRDLEADISSLDEKSATSPQRKHVSPELSGFRSQSVPGSNTPEIRTEVSSCRPSAGTQTDWTISPRIPYIFPPRNVRLFRESLLDPRDPKRNEFKTRSPDPILKEFQKQKLTECLSNIRSGLTLLRDPLRHSPTSSSHRTSVLKKLPEPQRHVSLTDNPRPQSRS